MNNIGKVVFYNFLKDGQKVERAHIFYKDGSDEDVSKYDGLKAFETIAMEENIDTNDNEQLESIYNKRIFVMEYKDLINNFNSFKYKDNSDIVVNKVISDEVDEVNNNEVALDENDYEDYFEDEIVEEKFPKVKGALNRAKNKIKNTSLAKKITVTAIGVAVLFGLHSVLSKGSKSGEMYDSNLPVSQSVSDKLNDSAGDSIVVSSTFDRLLQQCQSEVQKNTMKLVGENLDYFNGTFADKFVENGKNVRAALTWDEMMSLIVAYNDYSVEDIKTIFNGYNITLSEDFAESFYKSYQNAFLQLEGAYILETSDTQVNIEKYITSEEGKKFVREYHELFLNAKQATGKEKLALVKEFYAKLRKDFSITDEVCRPGISHADANVQTRHYMLAIAPMVSAAENLFQNLETDYTLNDQEVKYFNEYGLCNIAKDMFQKVEFVLLNNSSEVTGVKYLEFKEQKIKELISSSRYVIDDAHRNLFELDAFMRAITVQNECFEEYNSSSTTKSSKS